MPSNCYGYALGIDISVCPGTRNGKDSKVFKWSDGLKDYPFIKQQGKVLMAACISDGLREYDSGKKIILLFVHKYEDCIDYHFLRRDVQGTWSCQDSTGGPITKWINNPIDYNRTLVDRQLETGVLKGQMFAGLLYLPSWDNMKDGWD